MDTILSLSINKLIQSLIAHQTQHPCHTGTLLLGMEFTQELSHAVYFQIQCVENKLYPHPHTHSPETVGLCNGGAPWKL